MKAQRRAIRSAASQRGWDLIDIEEDVASGASTKGRNGLEATLAALDSGEAQVLVVAKLDRLSRSLLDFASMLELSRQRRWAIVALDVGIDTTTAVGELTAATLMVFAQFERRRIGERIKEALHERRTDGVSLGRPRTVPEEVRRQIQEWHRDGASISLIARRLNQRAVPTGQGGRRWYPSTVARLTRER